MVRRILAIVLAVAVVRCVAPTWCGRDAEAWRRGDAALTNALAEELIRFEARDDAESAARSTNRFVGEWALVTHQMVALGLAQLTLADPARRARFVPVITRAAVKCFLPEMRDFGT